jgi:type IV pilus assembly protein PilM
MRFLRTKSASPIGLDIGGRHVKAAQLERSSAPCGWTVRAAALFARPTPGAAIEGAEVGNIMDLLYRRGFTGNRVVLPVPAEKLLSGILEVPVRANTDGGSVIPIEQIARMELARTHRCPPDSFEMGCWDLPTAGRTNRNGQVMAVGCAHLDADAFLDIFDSQGLEVVALDVRACALARAVSSLVGSQPDLSALLDLGWGSATVAVMYGGVVVYTRTLADAGARDLHLSLNTRLGLDTDVADYLLGNVGMTARADDAPGINLPPDARKLLGAYVDSLVQELTVSLSYTRHEYPEIQLRQLLLSGSGAAMPGLVEHLQSVLGIEARITTLPQLAGGSKALTEGLPASALTAAVGLAQFEQVETVRPGEITCPA